MKNIVMYTTPTCVYCHMAKEYLKSKNVEFTEKDLSKDRDAIQEVLDKSGQLGVPVIDIDGKLVIGFDRDRINALIQ